MGRPLSVQALLAVGVFLLLSGCTGDAPLIRGASGVPIDAGSETGGGSFAVRVKVVEDSANGKALEGAPIVIHHIAKPATAPSLEQLLNANATMGGRTGADGTLLAHLEKGQTYTFIAAVANHTVEARHLVKIGDEYATRPLLIGVYGTSSHLELKGSVPTTIRAETPIIRLGASAPKWLASELQFHPDNASNRQYIFRLRGLEAKFSYVVPPGGNGNLGFRIGIIAGGEKEAKIYWEKYTTIIVDQVGGQVTHTITLGPPDLANIGAVKNAHVMIGPVIYQSIVAPQCAQWNLVLDANFGTERLPDPRRPYVYPAPAATELPQPGLTC
jgi:hypothetical protein